MRTCLSMRENIWRGVSPPTMLLLGGCAIFFIFSGNVLATDKKKEQFLSEYSPAMKKLEECYRHLRMDVDYSYTSDDINKGFAILRVEEYASNGRLMLRKATTEKANNHEEIGGITVSVAAPDRSFFLKRHAAETGFVVSSLGGYAGQASDIRLTSKALFAPFGLYETTVKEYLANPAVVFTERRTIDKSGKMLARISFIESIDNCTRTGSLVFDPNASWALQEYSLRNTEKGKEYPVSYLKAVIEYDGKSEGGCPLVSRAKYWSEIHTKEGSPTVFNVELYSVTQIAVENVPKEEFTLAAYGVPEPNGESFSSGRFFLVTGNVILVIAVATYLIYRRAKPMRTIKDQ